MDADDLTWLAGVDGFGIEPIRVYNAEGGLRRIGRHPDYVIEERVVVTCSSAPRSNSWKATNTDTANILYDIANQYTQNGCACEFGSPLFLRTALQGYGTGGCVRVRRGKCFIPTHFPCRNVCRASHDHKIVA